MKPKVCALIKMMKAQPPIITVPQLSSDIAATSYKNL